VTAKREQWRDNCSPVELIRRKNRGKMRDADLQHCASKMFNGRSIKTADNLRRRRKRKRRPPRDLSLSCGAPRLAIRKTWYYPVITSRETQRCLVTSSAVLTAAVFSLSRWFSKLLYAFYPAHPGFSDRSRRRIATKDGDGVAQETLGTHGTRMSRWEEGRVKGSKRGRNLHWLRLNCFSRLLVPREPAHMYVK